MYSKENLEKEMKFYLSECAVTATFDHEDIPLQVKVHLVITHLQITFLYLCIGGAYPSFSYNSTKNEVGHSVVGHSFD